MTTQEIQDQQGAHINMIYRGTPKADASTTSGQTTPASRAVSRPRTRASAKAAGARFERVVADWLRANVSEWIDRRVRTGARDCGDIANLRTRGGRNVVVEVKDYGGRFLVGEWLAEAEVERVNDHAVAGLVVAKRRGVSDPGSQVVLMTVRDLGALLTEVREGATGVATVCNNG